MIYASDFRKGDVFEWNGKPYVVLDYQQVKPGKGSPFVRVKHRNLLTGEVKESAFNLSDKFQKPLIETKAMTYQYCENDEYYFLDYETFDMLALPGTQMGYSTKFLREDEEVLVEFFQGKAFQVELPMFVDLKVVKTEPGTSQTKAATVETGAVVQVPGSVKVGAVIRIDTTTGDYVKEV